MIAQPSTPSLSYLEDMARAAGAIIKVAFHNPATLATELKDDETVVTIADKRIHTLIADAMRRSFPHIPFLGEEGSSGNVKKDDFWLLADEVDGTGALTLGILSSLVMIALMHGSQPIMSVIYDPHGDRMYSAIRGQGAWCNGTPIHVQAKVPDHPVISVIGWPKRKKGNMLVSHMFDVVVPELHRAGCELYNVGSNFPAALVAAGTFSATIFPGSSLHDTAPGELLVREAGGWTTDLRGQRLSYDGDTTFGHIFSCDRHLHRMIVGIIEDALATT